MILGIDATNIRAGGGLTHLKEILKEADMSNHNISKVIIWASTSTLNSLPTRDWLIKETHPFLNKSFIHSFLYQIFYISKIAQKKYNCDLIFVPGSTFLGSFKNIVSLSQNMLPFEKDERNRFTRWQDKLRFKILFYTQKHTFKKSKAVVFLTQYAKNQVSKTVKLPKDIAIIPHGVNPNFTFPPKHQYPIQNYTFQNPFKLLYVSIVTVYKHQWNVAKAVLKLRSEGYPVQLDLVGGYTPESLTKLQDVMINDKNKIINFKGLIPYEKLQEVYKNADGFIFASSCENMPIILIEAMTSGISIASSNMGPMPEVLADAGFYFNPLDVSETYAAIKKMLDSKELRTEKAKISFTKSINYTWQNCSHKTFDYLCQIANKI